MPTLVPHVSVDLNELFQDRSAASGTLGGKPRRVVVMAVDIPIVFVIRVMRPKQSRAYRASEVLHVILLVWKRSNSINGTTRAWKRYGHTAGSNITSPQCHATLGTDEVQTSEVIPLAQWVLISIRAFYRKEFGGHDIPTILGKTKSETVKNARPQTYHALEAIEMKHCSEGPDKCSLHRLSTCRARSTG